MPLLTVGTFGVVWVRDVHFLAAEDINVQHCYEIGYADKEVSITAKDTTHSKIVSLYLIC